MKSNILKFRKNRQLNIGLIFFIIIFIYLIATIVMYITAPHVSVYEVRRGSILKDTRYTGLVIRNESIMKAPSDGFINYYIPDNSKVKVGTKIYSLSAEELHFSTSHEDDLEMTSAREKAIMEAIQRFNYVYHQNDFSEIYQLKSELKDSLGAMNNKEKLEQLDRLLAQGTSSSISLHAANKDGVVVYSVDGMEALSLEQVTMEHLNEKNYHRNQYSNNHAVSAGDAVCKIVLDDAWTVMVEVDEDTANYLQDKTAIQVNFEKDNQTILSQFTLKEIEGHIVACLNFEHSMVRYASERFIDIKLILNNETGLKIPKTAKTEKEFLVVPKDYIVQGGNSSQSGILKQSKDKDGVPMPEFTPAEIFYEDGDVVYLDPNVFDSGTVLLMPESNATYTLSEKRMLEGVYCINKGYAVFKQIKILCESDSYYIVEEGNKYGLSNYDHIALDSSEIKENDVVF